jgi:hypothetical protein
VALAPRLLEKMSFELEELKQPTATEIPVPAGHANLDSLSKDALEDLLAKELACADDLLKEGE